MKNDGIGCLTVVGIIFITLKLLAVQPVAHWSWLAVLSPFWLPAAIGIAVFIIILLFIR